MNINSSIHNLRYTPSQNLEKNIVEDIKQYNVVYFLKTTGKYSYIKFYFDKNMFVTYGHPYSDIEAEDVLLNEIIAKLS